MRHLANWIYNKTCSKLRSTSNDESGWTTAVRSRERERESERDRENRLVPIFGSVIRALNDKKRQQLDSSKCRIQCNFLIKSFLAVVVCAFCRRFTFDWWHCGAENCVKWHIIWENMVEISRLQNNNCDMCALFFLLLTLFYLPAEFKHDINNNNNHFLWIHFGQKGYIAKSNRQTLANSTESLYQYVIRNYTAEIKSQPIV